MSTLDAILNAENNSETETMNNETSVPKFERGSTYAIPLQFIVTEKNPSRYEAHSDAELKDLAASMKTYGQLSSCVGDVIEDGPDKGRVLLLAGNGRYKAAQLGGIPTLTVWIRSNRRMSHARVNLEENNARRSADTSMDRLKQIIELEAEGLKGDTISKALRLTPTAISQYRRLARLIPDLKTLLEDSERNRGYDVTDDDGEKKPRFRFSHALAMLSAVEKATKDEDERAELQERYLEAFRKLKNAKLALEAIGSPEDNEEPQAGTANPTTKEQVKPEVANQSETPVQASGTDQPGQSPAPAPSAASSGVSAEKKPTPEKPKDRPRVTPLNVGSAIKAASGRVAQRFKGNPVCAFADGIAMVLQGMSDGTSPTLWLPDEDVLTSEKNIEELLVHYAEKASTEAQEVEAQVLADKLAPPPPVNGSGKAARR